MHKAQSLTFAAALLAGTVLAGPAFAQDKKELAFVVNGASDFWKLAEAGVKKAQGELPTTICSSSIRSRRRPPCSSG